MSDRKGCHHQVWAHLEGQVDLVNKDHLECMDHLWVPVLDRIILYLDILIKALLHQGISKHHGMVPDQMVHQDHRGVQVDLVVHRNKGLQDQDLVSIDHQACNSMVVHLDLLVRVLLVDHLDILEDLQVILEVLSHDQNGIDHQECIMGLRDHQVSLSINICKARNLAKGHHREDLLQVLWVVQAALLLDTEVHLRAHLKDHQEDQHHMLILHSSHKDLINIPGNILQDLLVLLMVLLMGHLMDLLMGHLMGNPMVHRMDHRMYPLMAMGHPQHSHLMVHQGLIIVPRVLLHSLIRNLKK